MSTKGRMLERLRVILAGRAAEEVRPMMTYLRGHIGPPLAFALRYSRVIKWSTSKCNEWSACGCGR